MANKTKRRTMSESMPMDDVKKHMMDMGGMSDMEGGHMMAMERASKMTKAREAMMGADSEMGMDEKLAYEQAAEMENMMMEKSKSKRGKSRPKTY